MLPKIDENSPIRPKVVYQTSAGETFETADEALIAHYESALRPLLMYNRAYNITHILQNREAIIAMLQDSQIHLKDVPK